MRILALAIAPALLASACATAPADDAIYPVREEVRGLPRHDPGAAPVGPEELAEAVGSVSNVAIALDPRRMPDHRVRSFRAQRAGHALRAAMLAELERRGELDPDTPIWLAFTVTGFELRSTLAGFFLGSWAGSDSMSLLVTVMWRDSPLWEFPVRGEFHPGGPRYPTAGVRLDLLAQVVALETAEILRVGWHIAEPPG